MIWKNAALAKHHEGMYKHYALFGTPIYRPYASASEKATEYREIGSGANNVVIARRNPLSGYYLKIPKYLVCDTPDAEKIEHDYEDLADRADFLNELNRRLCRNDPQTNAVCKHFAVEFLKEIRGSEDDPVPVFLTPSIKGFGLDSFVRTPEKFERYLPPHELQEKLDEMGRAIEWMHGNGLLHNDFKLSNFFFDIERKALVMIDFECADRIEDEEQAEEEMNEWLNIAAIAREAAEIDVSDSENRY